MRYINKKSESQPSSLTLHKNTPNHNYENYAEKDDLRKALLTEQEFLCCYCMKKIQTPTEDKMKIEHFKPFSIYNGTNGKADLTLEYNNLFASCKGGEGGTKNLQHCDKTKGNTEIKLNPTDKHLVELIKFDANGTILTGDDELDNEIDNILRLNIQSLKKSRKEIWESLEQVIKKEFGKKTVTKSFVNEKIKIWSRKNQFGMAEQYCQVAIYYLTKKLKKAE